MTKSPDTTRWALAGLCLSMLLPALGTSIANVALPTLADAFAASFEQVRWVVLAYLLSITSLVVAAGRLADIVGRRRLLLSGIVLFALASAAGGAADQLWLLVLARAVQGAGAAVMMSLAMAFVADVMPRTRIGRAMGLIGTMSAVGTALGPSLGGVLIATIGWPAIFLVNLPLAAAAFLLARRCLPADAVSQRGSKDRFDHRGAWLLASALVAYALAMTTGGAGFGTTQIALLALAGAGTVFFVMAQGRTASPLIQISILRDPVVSRGLALSALVMTVMMTTLVVGPFYLSRGLSLDAAAVGLAMSAGPAVAALMGIPAGRLTDRFGAPSVGRAGLHAMAAGSFALGALPTGFGVVGYVAPVGVLTAGFALFQTANNTAVMARMRAGQRGAASGLLGLSRNLGLITGASLMATVFGIASAAPEITLAASSAVAAGMRVTFAAAGLMLTAALLVSTRGHLPAGAATEELT